MDQSYFDFCTSDRQRQVLKAVIDAGSQRKAAKALGINSRSLEKMMATIRLNAAMRGFSPSHDMTHPTPPSHLLKGTSTLYRADGSITQQWVKTERAEQDLATMMRAAVDALKDDVPRAKVSKSAPSHTNKSLCNLYTITDYHFGMLSWAEETGADWDVEIAEKTLIGWFREAIACAPDAETCIFANLGDFLHWDGLIAITPTSGHVLDADTRFQRIVRIAIRCIRQIIGMLLSKHKTVHVIMADANHDPAAGVWLREVLSAFYEHERRVIVDNTADTYYCHEFGNTALFFHHGHKKKLSEVDTVFVAKFPQVYGRTKHRYAHTGHWHHDVVRESNLMKLEQHRTLAAPDAYASRGGWISGRDAKVIVYHADHGEVMRMTINYDMVNA